MSKAIAVRVPDDIRDSIGVLATREYRPYATMLVVLAREGLLARGVIAPDPPRVVVSKAEMDARFRAEGDAVLWGGKGRPAPAGGEKKRQPGPVVDVPGSSPVTE